MLIVADPALWSPDPLSGHPRYAVPIRAGTGSAIFSIDHDRDGPADDIDVQCPVLVEEPIVRRLPGKVSVACRLSCSERAIATITVAEPPRRMIVRLTHKTQGAIPWSGVLPDCLSGPQTDRPIPVPLDLDLIAAMLSRGDVDKALDELTAVWSETDADDRSAATVLLFQFLAEHPLKRAVILGALMASLCNFRATQ